jgi:ribosomal protein L35AE/L33A
MYIVRIEHAVPNFEGWRKAFDSDPAGRQNAGVKEYRIMRSVDEPNYVMIDLEFDTKEQAETFLASMRSIWKQVAGKIITGPKGTIAEVVETKKL